MMKRLIMTFIHLLFVSLVFGQGDVDIKEVSKQKKRFLKKNNYSYIPTGATVIGESEGDVPIPSPEGIYRRTTTFSIDSFFMAKYEVTNREYMLFISALHKNDTLYSKSMLPDTLVWRSRLGYMDIYMEYYLRHPSYQNYPVVGVSYNKAIEYASWLTKIFNEDPDRIYKKVKFRLPTEEEWEYAAKGGNEYAQYPWTSLNAFNSNGDKMANFRYISQASIYRDTLWKKGRYLGANGQTVDSIKVSEFKSTGYTMPDNVPGHLNDANEITAPVKSFWPNGYGLYNMSGNVEEMVNAYYYRDPNAYSFSHDINVNKAEDPSGVTRGGSWSDTGYYAQTSTRQYYSGREYSSAEIGFRLVMEVVEY